MTRYLFILLVLTILFLTEKSNAQNRDTIYVSFQSDLLLTKHINIVDKEKIRYDIALTNTYKNAGRKINGLSFSKIAVIKEQGKSVFSINKQNLKKVELLSPAQFLNLFKNKEGILDVNLSQKYVINLILYNACNTKQEFYGDVTFLTKDFYSNNDLIINQH